MQPLRGACQLMTAVSLTLDHWGLNRPGEKLQVVSWLVLGFSCSKVVFKETLQVLKCWALFGVFFPAVDHKLMQGDGAILRAWHSVAPFYLFQHFTIVHTYETQATARNTHIPRNGNFVRKKESTTPSMFLFTTTMI